MKNHIVPSGHNSPGKSSTYLTRQEAVLMHGGGVVAVRANSTSNLLCKACSPCMAFHAGSKDTRRSLQPLQNVFAFPTSTEMSIFLILPFYLPCLYLHPLLDNPICTIHLSLRSPGAPLASLWHQCLLPILPHLQLLKIFFFLISKNHTLSFRMLSIARSYNTS